MNAYSPVSDQGIKGYGIHCIVRGHRLSKLHGIRTIKAGLKC